MALWTMVLCFHWKSISSAKLPSMVTFFFTMTFDLLKILTIDKLLKRFEVLSISAVCMGIMERVNHPLAHCQAAGDVWTICHPYLGFTRLY